MDIERLKVDREYWDSVAPEGAEIFTPALGVYVDAFWRKESQWMLATEATDWEFRHGISTPDSYRVIPRPEPRQVEWDGEGLPPVGTICEALVQITCRSADWTEVEVLKVCEKKGSVAVMLTGIMGLQWTSDLRPIRTKEQRDREELTNILDGIDFEIIDGRPMEHGVNLFRDRVADAIIAAGWRKEP